MAKLCFSRRPSFALAEGQALLTITPPGNIPLAGSILTQKG